MRPYRQAGRKFFDLKLPTVDGRWVRRPVGTSDEVTANYIADVVDVLREKHAWDVLDRMTAKVPTLTIPQLWAWWQGAAKRNFKGRLIDAGLDERLDHVRMQIAEVNLDALVTEWNGGGNDRYLSHVRELIPMGQRFALEDFTRRRISSHLASRTDSTATKIRKRTSLSMFARWLIERELIETNPARDVSLKFSQTEKVARRKLRFYREEQAKPLILSLSDEYGSRPLEALMFASGIEWQAARRLRGRDFDLDHRTVLAQADKTDTRTRWIEVTEDWCWEIVEAYARTLAPNAPFVTGSWKRLNRLHVDACKRLELPAHTFHKYRHSFAVMWAERGVFGGLRPDRRDEQWLKNQLGHAPSSQLARATYGVYINAAKLTAAQEERLGITPARPNAFPQLAAMK